MEVEGGPLATGAAEGMILVVVSPGTGGKKRNQFYLEFKIHIRYGEASYDDTHTYEREVGEISGR